MKSTALAADAHITLRQLDHWHRTGLIHGWCDKPHGHGYPRHFTRREAAVVTLMGTLTRAGITPAYAETLARDLTERGWADMGGGLAITVQRTETEQEHKA